MLHSSFTILKPLNHFWRKTRFSEAFGSSEEGLKNVVNVLSTIVPRSCRQQQEVALPTRSTIAFANLQTEFVDSVLIVADAFVRLVDDYQVGASIAVKVINIAVFSSVKYSSSGR